MHSYNFHLFEQCPIQFITTLQNILENKIIGLVYEWFSYITRLDTIL